MKYLILLLSLVVSGCNTSDKKETDFFIDNNFKSFLEDDREIILTLNENKDVAFPVREAIFHKVFIKIMTAKSLLEDNESNWINELNRENFDYENLDTLCWATNYIKNYSDNIDEKNKERLTQSVSENIDILYKFKKEIIKLRDSKDDTLKFRLKLCK